VVARKDEFCGRIDRLHERIWAAARRRVQLARTRVHLITGRPGFAGVPGRVAMRGRLVAELGHALARSSRETARAYGRRLHQLERQLVMFDPRRRLAEIRGRLTTVDGRLRAAVVRRHDREDARFRNVAAQLDALSPLAVLGRGYAVCWDEKRTRALRDATDVTAGDRVFVTLARGELDCEVRSAGRAGR
jgi:exodeoxyribonuclease VII large subunit